VIVPSDSQSRLKMKMRHHRKAGVIDENGKPILDPARNLKTAEQGAATSVWCATSRQLNGMGGVYCENCDIAPLVPKEHETSSSVDALSRFSHAIREVGSMPLGVMPYAVDPESAERLCSLSQQLTFVGRRRL
jgi:hypothetical protein